MVEPTRTFVLPQLMTSSKSPDMTMLSSKSLHEEIHAYHDIGRHMRGASLTFPANQGPAPLLSCTGAKSADK